MRCSRPIQNPSAPPPLSWVLLSSHEAVLHRHILALHLGAGHSYRRLRFAAQTVPLQAAWPVADPQYFRTSGLTICCAESTTWSLRCSFQTRSNDCLLDITAAKLIPALSLRLLGTRLLARVTGLRNRSDRNVFMVPIFCLPTFNFPMSPLLIGGDHLL